MSVTLIVVLVVVVLLGLWAMVTYNRLVSRRNEVQEGWAGIDVQLQRRADLVPNLVETVKGYASHEEGVLTEVTQARAGLMQAQGPAQAGAADNMLEQALGKLFAVAEAYPDLKASENFQSLQGELSKLEEEISFARRYYNALVEKLNTSIQQFPNVLIAGPLGFKAAEFFKAGDAARTVPTVDFGT
jgi:LemA protein